MPVEEASYMVDPPGFRGKVSQKSFAFAGEKAQRWLRFIPVLESWGGEETLEAYISYYPTTLPPEWLKARLEAKEYLTPLIEDLLDWETFFAWVIATSDDDSDPATVAIEKVIECWELAA